MMLAAEHEREKDLSLLLSHVAAVAEFVTEELRSRTGIYELVRGRIDLIYARPQHWGAGQLSHLDGSIRRGL